MTPLRVYLLDHHTTFLDSLEHYLATHPNFLVVGRARSGTEALEQVPALTPDVVLVDLELPDMNGLVAAVKLKALAIPPRVVVLTLHDEQPFRDLARAMRLDGFVSKKDLPHQLLATLMSMSESNADAVDGNSARTAKNLGCE